MLGWSSTLLQLFISKTSFSYCGELQKEQKKLTEFSD